MKIIDIDKNNLPERFDIELGAELFSFEVNYNETGDFFTIDLYKNDEPLVLGEKIMLNQPLFH